MAKPKHPTAKSLRQGQTVYYVEDPSVWWGDDYTGGKRVYTKFMYSQRTKLPPPGEHVVRLPVSKLKKYFTKQPRSARNFYYSKKRAEAAAKK